MFLIFVEVEELFQDRQDFALLFFNCCKICNFSQKGKGLLAGKAAVGKWKKKKTKKHTNQTTQPCNLCFHSERAGMLY